MFEIVICRKNIIFMQMRKDIEWTALVTLLLILFIASIYVVRPFLDALILAAFFSYITYPLALKVEKILKSRTLTAAFIVALTILPVVLVGMQLLRIYSMEFSRLGEIKFSMPILERVDWERIYTAVITEIGNRLSPEKVLLGIGIGVELFVKAFIAVAGSFYMLKERVKLKSFLLSLAPPEKEYAVEHFIETTDAIFHGVFLGHFITAVITGFIAGIGFYLIGIYTGINSLYNYPLLLGFLVAITALLPIVGAWLVYVPISAFLLLLGDIEGAAIVLVFGVVILTIAPDIVIRPYIAGRHGKTHPFIVLLGFICGPVVFGAIGVVLGPAILGLFKAALDTYREIILKEQAK